ncbi:MAG: hypothetical protein ACI8V4_001233 [Ilumatobacter sp.]
MTTLTLRYQAGATTTTLNSLFDRIAPASPFSAPSLKLPSSSQERCPLSVSSLEGAAAAAAAGLDDLLGAFLHETFSTILEQRRTATQQALRGQPCWSDERSWW